jgi:hypothetical protein
MCGTGKIMRIRDHIRSSRTISFLYNSDINNTDKNLNDIQRNYCNLRYTVSTDRGFIKFEISPGMNFARCND